MSARGEAGSSVAGQGQSVEAGSRPPASCMAYLCSYVGSSPSCAAGDTVCRWLLQQTASPGPHPAADEQMICHLAALQRRSKVSLRVDSIRPFMKLRFSSLAGSSSPVGSGGTVTVIVAWYRPSALLTAVV